MQRFERHGAEVQDCPTLMDARRAELLDLI
jgi:hypothetical protein